MLLQIFNKMNRFKIENEKSKSVLPYQANFVRENAYTDVSLNSVWIFIVLVSLFAYKYIMYIM